ncbi:tetratricopeptide repeat protein [Actinophytocola xinjiangensis]|uniref:tetratricopeptide repeat protein n=1 Tax=Actinophytocola xinjiangensis TaxID=485602 RepID=UPI000B10E394|nr:tetratricopeptide repeat protein [Actinophytocola xinjiangensis]
MDSVLVGIAEIAQSGQRGDKAVARERFERLWEEIGGEEGDPLHRCTLAHAMADVQEDVRVELMWDQRALAAADLVTGERMAEAGVALPVAGLYPSLHLNLGECYRRLGDHEQAREHLRLAREGLDALADDDYGRLIRDGFARLEALVE